MFSRIISVKYFHIPIQLVRYKIPSYNIRYFGIIDSLKNSVTSRLEESNARKQGIEIYIIIRATNV